MRGRAIGWVLVAAGCVAGSYAGFRLGVGNASAERESPEARTGLPGERGTGAKAPASGSVDRATELARVTRDAFERRDGAAGRGLQERIADLGKNEVLVALEELSEIANGQEWRNVGWPLLRRLAQIDPPLALAQAERFTDGMNLISARAMILHEWAALSPQAALDKARALGREDLHGQFSYLHSVYGAWAEQDFEGVLRTAGTLEDPQEQDVALRALAREAAGREDPGAGLFRMAEAFPSPALQREFVGRAVEAWVQRTSLEEVERWIDAQEIETGNRAELLRFVARGEGHRNPRQAAEWLMGRSSPESRAGDLRTAVASWAYSHPEACGEWLAGQLNGPEADGAVTAYASALAPRDPGQALRWAARIHDDDLRRSRYHSIVRQMEILPGDQVREVLVEAGLDAGLVTELLEARSPE